VPPLQKRLGVDQATIQVTFMVFILLETWLVPFEGWLSYAFAGIGAGVVYGTAIGSALKWFPDHRGLAAGLTAAGFGAGSAFTVSPIANLIKTAGDQTAFIQWGIIQGAVVVIAALFLHAPPAGWLPGHWKKVDAGHDVKRRQTGAEFTSFQMAATPQFWLMYLMMTLVATGGLMAVAQLNPMAIDFGVAQVPVSFLFITLPAIQFALSADRLVNGLCCPFWGWVSDHIGREKTMTVAALAAGKAFDFRSDLLLLSGGALAVFAHFVGPVVLRLRISRKLHNALLYIGLCLVTYGIFLTVVPTAWTPFAAKFTLPKIGWAGVFTIAIVFDTVAGVLAWFVLRRMKLPSHVPHVSDAPHPKVVVQAGLEH
jgi:MFS transporter, OFA family, oxalate/formate antiporter